MTTVATASQLGLFIPAGGAAATTGKFAFLANPLVGAGVMAATAAITAIFKRKGPQQKIAATTIVNDVAPELEANLNAYFAGPRTRASQAAALEYFDEMWRWMTSSQALGNPELGDPGKRAIRERQRGGKYDMFRDLRDPIANDPEVRENSLFPAVFGTGNGKLSDPTLWIGIGLITAAVVFA